MQISGNYDYNGRMRAHEHSTLIDLLGGNKQVAAACRVSSQAVSKWRNEGIPPARLMYVQAVYSEAFRQWAEGQEKAGQPAGAQP